MQFQKSTAHELHQRVAFVHCPPSWACFDEVADGTGRNCNRHCDALAMSLWPSRGLFIRGFEIKVSRSDFRNELANPEKAEAVAKYITLNQIRDLLVGKVRETDPGYKGRRAMFQDYGFGKMVDLFDRTVPLQLRDVHELAVCKNHNAGWSFNRQLLPGDFGTPMVCFYNTAYRKQDLVGAVVHYRHRAASTAEPTEATKAGFKRPPIWYLYAGMGDGVARLAGSRDKPVCGTLNEVLRRANSYLRKIAQSVQDYSRSRRRVPGGQQPLSGIGVPARKKKQLLTESKEEK